MTTAVLDRPRTTDDEPPRRFGATEARIHTPPLDEHANPLCEYGIRPDATWGYDCIWFIEKVIGWNLLPWQKWLYCRALEKGPGGEGFRFQTLCILVARQNGKTRWIKGLTLWRLYLSRTGAQSPTCPAAKLALIAMQGLDFAEKMLADVNEDIKNRKPLKREWQRHWTANGKHRIQFKGRREWRATTANRKGGRSFSVDMVCLDELREHHNWLAWNAIVPTSITRQYSLVCCTSNAGDNNGIVLRSLRDSATRRITTGKTANSKLFLAEWSVPMDKDPKDPHYWYLANPAMGHMPALQLETLAGALENMEFTNMAGFQTEHLCQWVDALDPGIIPAEHWQETMDPRSEAAKASPIYAAVDINFQRSKAYIAIAGRRPDGHLHVEVVAAARGTDWIIPWFTTMRKANGKTRFEGGKSDFVAIAVQVRGAPASNFVKPMTDAGLPVAEWGGSELLNGCQSFFDKIVRHTVFHRPAASLDRSAAATVAKSMGDGWVFDRRHTPASADASPLIACAAAAWAEEQGPLPEEPAPEVHEWDEDQVEQWLREAAEEEGTE